MMVTTPSMSTSTTPVRFRVVSIEDGMLLRQLLCKRLHVPPAVAAEMVRAGGVYVGSVRICVPTVRVSEGERVTVYRAAAEIAPLEPGALRLLHRDEACVIVDKPHGTPAVATRAANRGTLAQALVQRLTQEGVLRPYVGLVHPLPAAAAGLALYTIRGQATESFYQDFAALPMTRGYRVRLRGCFSGSSIECNAPLGQSATGSWRLAASGVSGERELRAPVPAHTRFVKLAELEEETLASVELTAPSWEAIRLHAVALGLPLVGDGPQESGILCLLAHTLAFTHPHTGAVVQARASLPAWAAAPGEGEPVPADLSEA
jgi:23S rRNA-/tRNA-specific pseudouridylate synthase